MARYMLLVMGTINLSDRADLKEIAALFFIPNF